ncbi:MAG: Asp/Glu racemase [Lachnospiraceae bacterium]|nr:Asp/Glu racemase [Lachnospiraceae bacterium]GFI04320.1 hypothetical protein IMSAGC005_03172 [Lachnospiraceae bacterium]
MKKIGLIHTTPATVASLTDLVKEIIEDAEVINILDDSILPDMKEGGHEEAVRSRWICYARILEEQGAAAVLSACSTVGAIAEEADRILQVPVYRIDEAMIDTAIRMGTRISVLATLPSTLTPTVDLLKRKGGKELEINVHLVEGAYDLLMAGDRKEHDRLIRGAVMQEADRAQVILLAQASMAGALDGADALGQVRILTSPRLGIEKLKKDLTCQ